MAGAPKGARTKVGGITQLVATKCLFCAVFKIHKNQTCERAWKTSFEKKKKVVGEAFRDAIHLRYLFVICRLFFLGMTFKIGISTTTILLAMFMDFSAPAYPQFIL